MSNTAFPETWNEDRTCSNEFWLWYGFDHNALDLFGAFRRGFRMGAFEATVNMFHWIAGTERAAEPGVDASKRDALTAEQVAALDALRGVLLWLDGVENAAVQSEAPGSVIRYACTEAARRLQKISEGMEHDHKTDKKGHF